MQCSDCKKWLCLRVTDYEDGTRIVNFKSPMDKGQCEYLKIETDADFGCKHFEAGNEHIEIIATKHGSPWHHKHYAACPDCKGTGRIGEAMCGRCCCTGQVLHYDDGFIGEERTRRHPNEARIGPPPTPVCPHCSRGIEHTWKACPHCGNKLVPPTAEIVRASEIM